MASIAPELRTKLQRSPEAMVSLIVRVKDDPAVHISDVKSRGFVIEHTYSIISAMAIRGRASTSLTLANESWVISIEEDKQVHTM